MKKVDSREVIKTGCSLVAQIGSGILLGAIGGALIKNLGGNALVKGLATIGWFGISCKVSNDAKEGMEDYIDDIYELVDQIKDGKDVKVLKV